MEVPKEDDMAGSTVGSVPKSPSDKPIDADSLSGSDMYTTMSVSSSVWKFEEENGRTYHGYRAGVYYYPNDPDEASRLEYQSQVLDFALDGRLYFAPLVSPRTILDVGTGTGAWAIQMGDKHPEAIVEATDLSPIQPTNVPENVQFIIDDAEEEDWAVAENYYDYIHTRVMMGCFENFKSIIRKGFKYTKPGGWMESLECMNPPFCDDGTMPDDWPFKEWTETMDEAAVNANRPLMIANKLKKWYTEVGFVDVQEKVIKIPINSWPRDKHLKVLGKYWAENMLAGLQGFSLALFSRVFGWTKTEIEIYLVKIRKSITDHHVHAYTKVHIVWGRKPDDTETLNGGTTSAGPPQETFASTLTEIPADLTTRPSSADLNSEPDMEVTWHAVPYEMNRADDAPSPDPLPERSSTPPPPVSELVQDGADVPLPLSPTAAVKPASGEKTNTWRMSI